MSIDYMLYLFGEGEAYRNLGSEHFAGCGHCTGSTSRDHRDLAKVGYRLLLEFARGGDIAAQDTFVRCNHFRVPSVFYR
jgi:hypothetical protein